MLAALGLASEFLNGLRWASEPLLRVLGLLHFQTRTHATYAHTHTCIGRGPDPPMAALEAAQMHLPTLGTWFSKDTVCREQAGQLKRPPSGLPIGEGTWTMSPEDRRKPCQRQSKKGARSVLRQSLPPLLPHHPESGFLHLTRSRDPLPIRDSGCTAWCYPALAVSAVSVVIGEACEAKAPLALQHVWLFFPYAPAQRRLIAFKRGEIYHLSCLPRIQAALDLSCGIGIPN